MAQTLERTPATGRRKEATARVTLMAGSGEVTVNKRSAADYFGRPVLEMVLRQPFEVTETTGQYDIVVNAAGGGLSGQAGAVRLGIARALIALRPELRAALKKAGLLTRDARQVERKKYGQPKARKRFQYSKR